MPQLQQTAFLRSSRRQTAGASGLTAAATSKPEQAPAYRTHCE